MPEPSDVIPSPGRPLLGRMVAASLAALFLMVGLGIFWVWQKARREQDWRDQLQANDPILPASTR